MDRWQRFFALLALTGRRQSGLLRGQFIVTADPHTLLARDEPKSRWEKPEYKFKTLMTTYHFIPKLRELQAYGEPMRDPNEVSRQFQLWLERYPNIERAAAGVERTAHSLRRLYVGLLVLAFKTFPQSASSFISDNLGHISRSRGSSLVYDPAICTTSLALR
jgi:integrase